VAAASRGLAAYIPDTVRNLVRAVRTWRERRSAFFSLSSLFTAFWVATSRTSHPHLALSFAPLAVTLYSSSPPLASLLCGRATRPVQRRFQRSDALGVSNETPERASASASAPRDQQEKRFFISQREKKSRPWGFSASTPTYTSKLRSPTINQSSRTQTDFIDSWQRGTTIILIQSSLGFSNLRGQGRAQFSAPPPR
jgi:hypothetical protein